MLVIVRFLRTQNLLISGHTRYVCKKSMYNRILIDYSTNCTSTNVQIKIKLKS